MILILWKLILVVLIIVLLLLVIIGFVVLMVQCFFVWQQVVLGKINVQVEEIYVGYIIVWIFNWEVD